MVPPEQRARHREVALRGLEPDGHQVREGELGRGRRLQHLDAALARQRARVDEGHVLRQRMAQDARHRGGQDGIGLELAQVAVEADLDPLRRARAGLGEEGAEPPRQVHGRLHLVVHVAREREEVHRVLDDPALEEVADLHRDVRAHALLRLHRLRADVGSGHHARMTGQAPVRGRLLRMHVDGGRRHAPLVERGQERLLVHELPPCGVDDAHPALHAGQGLRAQQVAALARERGVQGDEVRALEQLVEPHQAHALRLGQGGGHEGIVGRDLHAQGAATGGHLAADAAEPDHAQPLARQLDSGEGLAVPPLRLHRRVGLGHVAGHREEEGEGQLRGGHEVAERRVHHHDPEPRGRLHVHVVDADPGAAHHLKVPGRLQDSGRDLAAAADGHGVVGLHDPRELVGRHGLLLVDLPAFRLQDLQPAVGDAFEDEDAVAHARLTYSSSAAPTPRPASKRWPSRRSTISSVASRPRMSVAS